MRALRIRIVSIFLVAVMLGVPCIGAARGTTWKLFSNRAGWTVRYPGTWHISSCNSCRDPKAPNVFVDFSPPTSEDSEGFVMISHLADKPKDMGLEAWLREIAASANQCPHVAEKRLTLNGLPAFTVRYRTAMNSYTEGTYVVAGDRTFSIEFSTDKLNVPLEKVKNYAVFTEMAETFRMGKTK